MLVINKIRFYIRAYNRLELMNKAASLSFYTLISVFPMILLLATILGHFISPQVMQDTLKRFIEDSLPYQADIVIQNMFALIRKKRTFGWFGFITLLVSAQILFVNFEKIVNGVMHTAKARHFLLTRLLFLGWFLGIILVLFTPVVLELVTGHLKSYGISIAGYAAFFARGGYVMFGFFIFLIAMVTMPTQRVEPKRLFWGSLSFALTLQVGKYLFKLFTVTNVDRYNLIYGSLSTLVLMTLWIFYFYNMFLFFIYWVSRHRDPFYIRRKETMGGGGRGTST